MKNIVSEANYKFVNLNVLEQAQRLAVRTELRQLEGICFSFLILFTLINLLKISDYFSE